MSDNLRVATSGRLSGGLGQARYVILVCASPHAFNAMQARATRAYDFAQRCWTPSVQSVRLRPTSCAARDPY